MEQEGTAPSSDEDPVARLAEEVLAPERSAGAIGLSDDALDNVTWHEFSEYNYLLEPTVARDLPSWLGELLLFDPGSVNFGIRLGYRQEWRCLGNQRGEIVKTIPLGPHQKEKVSTRMVRRRMVTQTSESAKSFETTTESSETTKDSAEVLSEATAKLKGHLDFNASVNFGTNKIGGSAGLKGGISGEMSRKSRATCSHLSEVMQKTASRMRNETKIAVSTESEATFETTRASEIENPNEEIAITYVYSKLQRQYEVFTGLAESQHVVFVALPMPTKVDYDWVRRHDWILAKALLDDSFRDALGIVSGEPPPEAEEDGEPPVPRTDTEVYETLAGEGSKLSSLSLAGTDISQESTRFREAVKAERERRRALRVREYKLKRLYHHIEDNILHYMRAIWAQEDPEQRLLRLRERGIQIPRNWGFVGQCGALQSSDNELGLPVGQVLAHVIERELHPPSPEDHAAADAVELQEVERDVLAERDATLEAESARIRADADDAIARLDLETAKAEAVSDLEQAIRDEVALERSSELATLRPELEAGLPGVAAACAQRIDTWNATKAALAPAYGRAYDPDHLGTMMHVLVELNAWVLGALNNAAHLAVVGWHQLLLAQIPPLREAIAEANRLAKLAERMAALAAAVTEDPEAIREVAARVGARKQAVHDEVQREHDRRVAEIEIERNITIVRERAAIVARYAAELERKLTWVRNKLAFERRQAFTLDGDFVPVEGSEVPLADLIDSAGPIGFHGNYAIYLLRPEVAASDLLDILTILQTPYLRYASADREPELVDPFLKSLIEQHEGVTPPASLREEMIDYVPRLRQRHRQAVREDDEARRSFVVRDSAVDALMADDAVFAAHYAEYLFRKDLTRRFPVDTNNVLVDIELGRGTALEPFKNAHRGLDVLRAQEERDRLSLENERMRALLSRGELGVQYWPEPHRVVMMPADRASASPGIGTTGTPAVIVQPDTEESDTELDTESDTEERDPDEPSAPDSPAQRPGRLRRRRGRGRGRN